MGYRFYMYTIAKDTIDEIKSLSLEELTNRYREDEEEDWFNIHNLPTKKVHNFGKMYDESPERIYAKGIPLFENKDVMEELSDYHPYVVGKEGLLEAIQIYKEKVIHHYSSLLEDTVDEYFEEENKTAAQKQEEHVKSTIREWQRGSAINLNEEKEIITSSWRYEYSVFELVRQLKTIDFEKETIIFYGW